MSLSRGLSKVKNFLNLIEVPAILLLVWGAVSHFGLFPEFLLPSPEKVWSSFVELLVCGELWKHIAASAGRVFGGFFLAMLVAIPLAYFFYYSPASEKRAVIGGPSFYTSALTYSAFDSLARNRRGGKALYCVSSELFSDLFKCILGF